MFVTEFMIFSIQKLVKLVPSHKKINPQTASETIAMAEANDNTQSVMNIVAEKEKKMNIDAETQKCLPSKAVELLYMSNKGSDIYFTFHSTDERIAAHKTILAVSPVFDATIFDPTFIGNEMKIEDASFDAYKEFLQLFYLRKDKIKLSMEHIESVVDLCEKYQIIEYLKPCLTSLEENLDIENMCLAYKLAIRCEQHDLLTFCERKIGMHTEKVLQSHGFLNCDWKVLDEIVKLDELNCSEPILLEACISWAQNACQRYELNANDKENLRNQLKDVIYNIRFNQFTVSEFVRHLKKNPNNPYHENELNDIIFIMAKEDIGSSKFNLKTRISAIPWNAAMKLECKRWSFVITEYIVPNIVLTKFSSDETIIFGEFEIFIPIPSNRNVCCTVSVRRNNFGRSIESFTEQNVSTAISHIITLPKPIVIEANVEYEIQLDFSSNSGVQLKSYIGMSNEVELSNGTTVTFHGDAPTEFDCLRRGVINRLSFNEIPN